MKFSVIVAGGGAAGLMAACELSQKGYFTTLVEASDRIGGRIHTFYPDGSGASMELGAEFVHGALPLTLSLLKQAGIKHEPALSNMHRVQQGQWQQEEEQIEGWDELAEKIKKHPQDITLENFLTLYFNDARYEKLRESVLGMAEGLDLADSHKASMQSLWDEWSHEQGEQYRVKGGYGQLIDYLADTFLKSGGKIINNFSVNAVAWKENSVHVSAADGRTLEANKLILTVPVSVLQTHTISFSPAIPQVQEAVSNIGWGKVIKFLLKFNENLSSKKELGIILSDELIPTWWTQDAGDNSLLTGWLGGPKAAEMEQLSEEVLRDMALSSLSGIFGLSTDELLPKLKVFKVIKWGTVPFIGGGYSYEMPESTAAKQVLKASVQQTIFFAGEAMYTGASKGTVEAALISGKEVTQFLNSKIEES